MPSHFANSLTVLTTDYLPSATWAAALLSAVAYSLRSAKRMKLDLRAAYWAATFATLFGLWGAYLLGLVYYGSDGQPYFYLRFWSAGRAEYGGLLAGILTVAVYLRIRRLSFLRYGDALVPALLLGVSIGRVGCFFNGDDFGIRSRLPWAVCYPPGSEAFADHLSRGWIALSDAHSLPVHPVQLYASLFALLLFFFFVNWSPARHGLRFALFLVVYGSGRFLDQFLRGDFQRSLGPFSLTQLLSLLLIAAGLLLCVYLRAVGSVRNISTPISPADMRQPLCPAP
jgi:phosphatidylglycerol:prolipoprotein diacylglycerol transferase